MKYKEFWVETGTKELTDAVIKHGEYLGYKSFCASRENINNVFFFSDGDYVIYHTKHNEEKLSIQDFFKLTKEDVIMKPEIKTDQDLLHRLDDFFTKLLAGEVEIKDEEHGLCKVLSVNGFYPDDVFDYVIDVEEWDKYSGDKACPVPLEGMSPTLAYDTHDDLWDKKHPYGRNRWKFVKWCHEQVKAQIEQDDIEFPVLAEHNRSGTVILFTKDKSGVCCNEKSLICRIGEHNNDLWPVDSGHWKIIKTAKELGLTLRGEK